ncbi:MAG: P-loop NTPase [Candidatus Gastranaerophilales bacterium]|nr:P-loop NTPase [Candidatus Gastranaerophilales bacterium]
MTNNIKNKIVVMSGKGGVGKSTVATNIATSLALKGYKTGLLDVDIHGPSIPTIFGLEGQRVVGSETGMLPLSFGDNLKIISIGFLIDDPDCAIIWRGPAKAGVIQQFINDVDWGELDYLIVDCPPGTGDEPLSVIQMLEGVTGAVIVTTPQKLAIADVRKSVNFCEKLEVPVLGVIENMSGFICTECNKTIEIFKSGGGEKMAQDMNVPFLGKIPLDPNIVDAGDSGKPFLYFYSETPTAKIMEEIIKPITENSINSSEKGEKTMKFAIPTAEGKLCQHFGHCEKFVFIEVDETTKTIISNEAIQGPAHAPGILPPWVAQQGATIILAGGMGGRAQELFAEQGIEVISGCPSEDPAEVVMDYLNGTLETGVNGCDHSHCGSH